MIRPDAPRSDVAHAYRNPRALAALRDAARLAKRAAARMNKLRGRAV